MNESVRCFRCGAVLTGDDIGLTRKMVNRGAEVFFCVSCLADHFQLSEEILRIKITEFKAMGCTLFKQKDDGSAS